MRIRWAVLVAGIILSSAVSAFAAGTGPQIGIGDPNCSSWNKFGGLYGPATTIDSSNSFEITVNSNGGGFFGFCNGTTALWNTVDIKFITTTLEPGDIGCTGGDVFDTCDQSRVGNVFELYFHGVQNGNSNGSSGGIPIGGLMTLNLFTNCDPTKTDCTNATGLWDPGMNMFGGTDRFADIPTPEPTTLVLLGMGLVAVGYRRRK